MILRQLSDLLMALVMGICGALIADRAGWIRGTPGTPIAILDRGALLRAIEREEAGTEATKRQFEKKLSILRDQGYLVIDQGWVISAPEALHADIEP